MAQDGGEDIGLRDLVDWIWEEVYEPKMVNWNDKWYKEWWKLIDKLRDK